MLSLRSSRISGIAAAACFALAQSVLAQAGTQASGFPNNETRHRMYVDFAATTIPGHAAEPTGTFGGVAGLKYHSLQVLDQGGTGACFEVTTTNPDFIPGAVADTRIWRNSGANYVTLNNDYAGGGTFSRARFYVRGNGYFNVRVAARTAAWNSAHFCLNILRRNITEAACTTGQNTFAWAKNVNGVVTSGGPIN